LEAVYVDQHSGLVAECRQGNQKAQFELYRLYSKSMFNTAMRIVNHTDEAADILQEAFLDAFLRIADFRQETTFGLWIKRIVINKAISHLRKKKMEWVGLEDEQLNNVAAEENEAKDKDEELQLQAEEIRKAIQLLPGGYRIVLSLYLLEGYDHEEISHILQISENTSRTQFLRAKRKLIENIKKHQNRYN